LSVDLKSDLYIRITTKKNIKLKMSKELETKLTKIFNMLAGQNLDALLLQGVDNFAWATCGAASYINTADSQGVGSLLITPKRRYLITNNIEAPRFQQEEELEAQGWEFVVSPWYEPDETISRLTTGMRLGADGAYPGATNLSEALTLLRMDLLPEEGARFKAVSQGCASAMQQAIQRVEPGMTEYQIASLLNEETQQRGILPVVNLIATDERIYSYRHPLPTDKKLDRYAMLVLCGRKYGLVCSLTRLVHFGSLPDELRRKSEAVAAVDAAFIASTQPGATLSEIFRQAQKKYAEVGFADEWQLHHQGGPAGYNPREAIATPSSQVTVAVGQVYAWNPSITGTKSEDTILVTKDSFEIMSEIPGWPMFSIDIAGLKIPRPMILEK
jgi:antitoxin VapB